MTFRKTAVAVPIAHGEWAPKDGRLARTASHTRTATSYFMDGARVLDFEPMLQKYANEYKISHHPRDYMFEAIRANTAEAPNENEDGFTKRELLTFRPELGLPVYATYVGKPHQVNHRAADPTRARGIIVDAHYNNESTPLPECPQCKTRTAERSNRDSTGIYCKRCGFLTKDDFVEILLAVDTKKDPAFAKGVRDGILRAGSMGCSCLSTDCNVCSHTAYSKPEFCAHIRNKGSIWLRAEAGADWRRGTVRDVEREAKKRGMEFVPVDFVGMHAEDGFEARRANEWCNDVVYEEYSRVARPADPKALHREFLKAASVAVPAALSDETEMLIRAASTEEPMSKAAASPTKPTEAAASPKAAAKFFVARVDGDDMDTCAAATAEEAVKLCAADAGATVEVGEVEAQDAGAARLMKPASWSVVSGQAKDGDVQITAPANERVVIVPEGADPNAMPPVPGVPPVSGQPGVAPGIEQYTEDQMANPPAGPGGAGPSMTPAELGIMPPGAAKQSDGKDGDKSDAKAKAKDEAKSAAKTAAAPAAPAPVLPYAAAYADWRVAVGAKDITLQNATGKPVARFAFEGDRTAGVNAANDIFASLSTAGLVATVAKSAQLLDDGIDDMVGPDRKPAFDQITEGGETNMDETRPKPQGDIIEGGEPDNVDGREKPKPDVLVDGTADFKREDKKQDSVTEDKNSLGDMAEPRKDPPSDVLKDGIVNFGVKGAFVGAKVAHADAPDELWTVTGALLRGASGGQELFVARGAEQRKLAAADMLYWRNAEPTVAEAVEAYEEQVRTAFAARLADVKKDVEAQRVEAQVEALVALRRSMDIVSKRFAAGLEELPLRVGLETALRDMHAVGRDPRTGREVVYPGMHEQLANVLVAEVIDLCHDHHVESLLNRAASLMGRSAEYIDDAEAEAATLRVAMPTITEDAVRGTEQEDLDARHAAAMRREAARGNLVPALPETEGPGEVSSEPADVRKMRAALSGTRVSQQVARLSGS